MTIIGAWSALGFKRGIDSFNYIFSKNGLYQNSEKEFKIFHQTYSNYNDFMNGLESIDANSWPIELYYLSYEKQHNPINFVGGEIKF